MIKIIKKYINKVTGHVDSEYNRKVILLGGKEPIIKDDWFDDFFGNLFWWWKAKEIGLHGGLGDVILLLPHIERYKRKYSFRKLRIVYNDNRADDADPKNYGLGKSRFEETNNGDLINPIQDFLENVTFIDEKIAGSAPDAEEFWFPDGPFRRKWGDYLSPTDFKRKFYDKIFVQSDRDAANEFWRENSLKDKFVVAFHFRRASDKIKELYDYINNDEEMSKDISCLLIGSSRNQILPELDQNAKVIDLFDNYSKGIGLRVLYQIIFRCSMYVGGRGSFEHFFWLMKVPSINFIDKHALEQDHKTFNTWIPEFWIENKFKEPIVYETAEPKDVFERMVKPYYEEWKIKQVNQEDGL